MSDCVIVGGGVIGLSLAYQLSSQGMRVRVLDTAQPAREASWAGAGILPPASQSSPDALERLTALSNQLHAQWSEDLREQTSIDNGYRRCGAVYLARTSVEAQQLDRFAALSRARDIVAQRLPPNELATIEPNLRPSGSVASAYLVPDECQIRNPRHLKALQIACSMQGVEIHPGVTAEDFDQRGGRVRTVLTNVGPFAADRVCVTTGSWTGPLAKKLGVKLPIKPIRGQMVLLSQARPVIDRIINEEKFYLVPRADGRTLVGSTEEDVGFDKQTTAGVIGTLLDFALSLVPGLSSAQVERSWAGLRPHTADGLPFLGRVPGLENAFVAAGHYRGGLQLSTGTAIVMSQLIRGARMQVDLTPFRLDRGADDDAANRPTEGRPSTKKTRPEVKFTDA